MERALMHWVLKIVKEWKGNFQASRINRKLWMLLQWIASLHPARMDLKVCFEVFLWAKRKEGNGFVPVLPKMLPQWGVRLKRKICATMGFVGSSAPAHWWWCHGLQKTPLHYVHTLWVKACPCAGVCPCIGPYIALILHFGVLDQRDHFATRAIQEITQSSWEQSNKARGWGAELQLENHLAMSCLENASKHVE